MAKKWGVMIPITGQVYKEVEAESEEEAIKLALNSDFSNEDLEGWEPHRRVAHGNVVHAQLREAYAEEIDDGDGHVIGDDDTCTSASGHNFEATIAGPEVCLHCRIAR